MLTEIDRPEATAQPREDVRHLLSDPTSPQPASEVRRPLPPALRVDPTVRDVPAPSESVERTATSRDHESRRHKARRGLHASLAALLLASVAGGSLYWDSASRFETTDDAFIAARQFAVAPKVAGYITAVPVTDNEHVAAGNVIARIDDRDYRAAIAQADAQVAAAQASIQSIDGQIDVQQAQVALNAAQIQQQQAGLTYAAQQSTRYATLAHDGWGTVQNAQQWASQERQGEASVKSAQQALVATQRQLAVLKAQRENAEANLAQATAQRDQARLNLSYTTVVAAQPGRIVQLSASVGQYAQPGTALTMFVPDDIWVTANFKENQLARMRPGQAVTLHIDAYPEHAVHGHVASVQPGSGTAFSLLPAENATGNYVKIVQRVPVKIVVDNPPTDIALGPGMSVVPTVRVDPSPSLAGRLESVL
jgi:membrane fusion protein, multidrug efflux system